MKFTVSIAVLALVVAVVAGDTPPATAPVTPPATDFCSGKDTSGKLTYKDLGSTKGLVGNYHCMKYHECTGGKDVVHHCFWLIPLRQYDPKTRQCTWFWKANCADADPQ